MSAIHHTPEYRACLAELKARGRWQTCITAGSTPRCPVRVDALAPKGHPNHMTLGHLTDVDAGGAPYDPRNYGPQCAPCNYAGGAHRTNRKRRGIRDNDLRVSPDWV